MAPHYAFVSSFIYSITVFVVKDNFVSAVLIELSSRHQVQVEVLAIKDVVMALFQIKS